MRAFPNDFESFVMASSSMSRIFRPRRFSIRCALESEFDLLGLFQGVGLPFQSETVPELMPNMIWLYRRPILDYWAEHEDTLGEIVTHVLVHEIGHHFGLSDEDIEAIEAAARIDLRSRKQMATIQKRNWSTGVSASTCNSGRFTMIVTVFRSRLMPDVREEYVALVDPHGRDAAHHARLYFAKGFFADDGERVTVVEFEHEEGMRAGACTRNIAPRRKRHAKYIIPNIACRLHPRAESKFKREERATA